MKTFGVEINGRTIQHQHHHGFVGVTQRCHVKQAVIPFLIQVRWGNNNESRESSLLDSVCDNIYTSSIYIHVYLDSVQLPPPLVIEPSTVLPASRLTSNPPKIKLKTTTTTAADVPVRLDGNNAPRNKHTAAKDTDVNINTSQKYVKLSTSSATPDKDEKGKAKNKVGMIRMSNKSLHPYARK